MGIFNRLFGAKPADDAPAAEPSFDEYDDDDEYHDEDDVGEGLNVWDAADIYFDSGFDEDRMFGYSHDELVKAHESGG